MELIDIREFSNEALLNSIFCQYQDTNTAKLRLNDIYLAHENVLTLFPNLKEAYNLHVEITNTDKLLQHKPIEGLAVHYKGNIDELLSKLSNSWVKTIHYLKICSDDNLHCVIYRDKINIEHRAYSRLELTDVMNKHYRELALCNIPKHVNIYHQPKEIEDLDRQLQLECSPVLSYTLIYLPPYNRICLSSSVVKKHKVLTPLWLCYYVLNYADVEKLNDEHGIKYKIKLVDSTEVYTLKELMYTIIVACKAYVVPNYHKWVICDPVLRALLWIEAYYMGHSCNVL